MAFASESLADVVNGEVLFAHLDDVVADRIRLRGGGGSFSGRAEELAMGILPELVAHDAEGARGVTEESSGVLGGGIINKEGAEGLVLSMGGIGRLEEEAGEVGYFI